MARWPIQPGLISAHWKISRINANFSSCRPNTCTDRANLGEALTVAANHADNLQLNKTLAYDGSIATERGADRKQGAGGWDLVPFSHRSGQYEPIAAWPRSSRILPPLLRPARWFDWVQMAADIKIPNNGSGEHNGFAQYAACRRSRWSVGYSSLDASWRAAPWSNWP